MRTQPINNINFKALYVKDFDYSDPQRYAINNIRNGLDKDSIDEIAAKGFDVFIENDPENRDEVTVSAIKGFNSTDESSVKECRKIVIGNYGAEELCSEFNVSDINSRIDEFQKQMMNFSKFGKVLVGILLAATTAIWVIAASRAIKPNTSPEIRKATTEVLKPLK